MSAVPIAEIAWCAHHEEFIEHGECWAVRDYPDDCSPDYCRPAPTEARRLWTVEVVVDQTGARHGPGHGGNGISHHPDTVLNAPWARHQHTDRVVITARGRDRHHADDIADDIIEAYTL